MGKKMAITRMGYIGTFIIRTQTFIPSYPKAVNPKPQLIVLIMGIPKEASYPP